MFTAKIFSLITHLSLLYCRPLITQHRTTTTHMAEQDQTRRLPVLPWQHYDIESLCTESCFEMLLLIARFNWLQSSQVSISSSRVDLTCIEIFCDSILHIQHTCIVCTGCTSCRYAISFCAQNGVREFSNTSEIHCTTFSHIVKL